MRNSIKPFSILKKTLVFSCTFGVLYFFLTGILFFEYRFSLNFFLQLSGGVGVCGIIVFFSSLQWKKTLFSFKKTVVKEVWDCVLPNEFKELEHTLQKLLNDKNQKLKELELYSQELENNITHGMQEMKKMQNQLIQAGKLAAVGELTAGIAHELNNPIGGILGYSQFMYEKMSDLAEKGEPIAQMFLKYLEFIARDSQRCKKIIQNLLKFSRSAKMEFTKIDVNVVLADTIEIVQHQIRLEQIEFEKYFTPLPLINGDATQLQQVFLNILLNAIQAIPENRKGNIIITTNLLKQNEESFVEIKFKDNGCGIPDEYLNKIFNPFFTSRKTGEGTGLGLSLSYGIIKDHNGTITVDTEVDKGSTFIITLPESV